MFEDPFEPFFSKVDFVNFAHVVKTPEIKVYRIESSVKVIKGLDAQGRQLIDFEEFG